MGYLGLSFLHHFLFFRICTVSENKYSLICFTFTGTLNQLHFILVFIFHIISFFSFSHLIFKWSTLTYLLMDK